MSDSRITSPTTSEAESDHMTRNVRPRTTILPGDPYLQSTSRMEDSEEEEPFETHPLLPSASPTVPSPAASPVPSPPAVPESPTPRTPPPAASLWDWMPKLIDWWRRDEQVPVLPPITEPPTPISPFTREAVHDTVPVLVARLRSHEYLIEWLEKKVKEKVDAPAQELEELHQQLLGAESEMMELRDEVVSTQTVGIQTRDEVIVLRQELNETRQSLRALQQEVAAMRTERDQFRADAESSARLSDLIGRMGESLLR